MSDAAMHWAQIAIAARPDEADAVGWALVDIAGCQGWELIEDGAEPGVIGYLPIDDRLEEKLLALKAAIGRPLTLRKRVAEEDWAHAWKQYFKPQRIGERLVVKPTWEAFEPEAGDRVIEIDPGMAFGTGLHATTRLCLRALEAHVAPGMRIADVGTGSGILAVAAVLLGAAQVEATDNDPLAVGIARRNAAVNGVEGQVQIAEAALPPHGPFDIVVANILADVILGMRAELAAALKPGGLLIASGIIDSRADDVRRGLESAGLRVAPADAEGEWVALRATRPA